MSSILTPEEEANIATYICEWKKENILGEDCWVDNHSNSWRMTPFLYWNLCKRACQQAHTKGFTILMQFLGEGGTYVHANNDYFSFEVTEAEWGHAMQKALAWVASIIKEHGHRSPGFVEALKLIQEAGADLDIIQRPDESWDVYLEKEDYFVLLASTRSIVLAEAAIVQSLKPILDYIKDNTGKIIIPFITR